MAGNGAIPVAGGDLTAKWYIDERDSFMLWLRGEFAAANAMIDGLIQHLRATNYENGEYENVFNCIQQRRANWTPVIHMQQYYSVSDVLVALQNAAYWKQHQCIGGDRKVGGFGNFGADRNGGFSRFGSRQGSSAKFPEKDGLNTASISEADYNMKNGENSLNGNQNGENSLEHECETSPATEADCNGENSLGAECSKLENAKLTDTCASHTKEEREWKLVASPKVFLANEMRDGKQVNVADGLKQYAELVDISDVTKLVSLSRDLRASGRKGELRGQTYVASQRPMRGHGREMIQLGTLVVEQPSEVGNTAGSHRERKVEVIPSVLEDVLDRLVRLQILTIKPDFCIIDFFSEGEYSQPYFLPYWYGRPVCSLSLTDCDMVFSQTIGDLRVGYQGAFKLSLGPGDLIVMEGKSADVAKRAIPSIRKQRILLTLGKSKPRKSQPHECHSSPHSTSRPHQNFQRTRPSSQPKHHRNNHHHHQYSVVPTTTITPTVLPCSHHQPPPMFVSPPHPVVSTTPVPMPVPYPTPIPILVASSPPPRAPVPGTGVFLPSSEKDNGTEKKANGSAVNCTGANGVENKVN